MEVKGFDGWFIAGSVCHVFISPAFSHPLADCFICIIYCKSQSVLVRVLSELVSVYRCAIYDPHLHLLEVPVKRIVFRPGVE